MHRTRSIAVGSSGVTFACFLNCGLFAQTNASLDISNYSTGGGSTIAQAVIARPDGYWVCASMRTGGANDPALIALDGALAITGTTGLTAIGEDTPTDLVATPDGGAIMTGVTTSFTSAGLEEANAFLVKFNAERAVEWARQYGGPGADRADRVHVTGDGGYLLVGTCWGQGAGASDAWMARTDGAGMLLWSRTYGGALDDTGNDAVISDDGTITLVGTTGNVPTGNAALVIHTDGQGVPVWKGSIDMDEQPLDWNVHDRRGSVIVERPEGGYCIGGTTGGLLIGGGQASMAFLLALDTAGSTIGWCRSFHLNSGHTWFTRLWRGPDRYEAALEMGAGFGAVMRATTAGERTWSRYLSFDPPFAPCRTLGFASTVEGGFVVSGYHLSNGDTTLLVAHGRTTGDLCFQGSTGPQFFLTGSDPCDMGIADLAVLSGETGSSTSISFSGSDQSPQLVAACTSLSTPAPGPKEPMELCPTLCTDLGELRFSRAHAAHLELLDAQGRCIGTAFIRADGSLRWNGMPRPSNGIYLLRIRDTEGRGEDFRFVLDR